MKRQVFFASIALAILLLGIGASVVFASCPAPAPRYDTIIRYVATTGADVDACTTPAGACRTVQYAVDQAVEGDEIRVTTGAYTDLSVRSRADVTTTGVVTQVVYVSKSIAIRGGYTTDNWTTPDAEANPTTLDAQGLGRVIYAVGDVAVTLENLRITGGDAAGLGGMALEGYLYPWDTGCGGGVYAITATVAIEGSQVSGNTASYGGGMYVANGVVVVAESQVSNNTAGLGSGGGMNLYDSDATLSGNTFVSNTAGYAGGALLSKKGKAVLSGNTIISNTASDDSGGGLYLYESSVTLSGNTVSNNSAGESGGGLIVDECDATLNGNVVSGNTAGLIGGGLFLVYSPATLNGNVFTSNTANEAGGLLISVSDATLTNNVVANNHAAVAGGGLYVYGSSPRLLHTTIAHNGSTVSTATLTAGTSGGGSGVYVTRGRIEPSTVAMTNTILAGHTVGISVAEGNTATLDSTLWYANGTDYSGNVIHTNDHTGDPAFATDDYHLTSNSAAIDRGVEVGVNDDVDSNFRPVGTAPDLGADEFWYPNHFVYLPVVVRAYPQSDGPPYRPIVVEEAPDDCPGLPVQIESYYRENFDHEGDEDWYTFVAEQSQVYVLYTTDLGEQSDTVLYLYDTDCSTFLVANDDTGYPDDLASTIIWTAPADGAYHAMVRSWDPGKVGLGTEYTFSVDRYSGQIPTPAPTPTPESSAQIPARLSPPKGFEMMESLMTAPQARLPYTVTVFVSPTVEVADVGDTVSFEVFVGDIPDDTVEDGTMGAFQLTLEYDGEVLNPRLDRSDTYANTYLHGGWLGTYPDQRTWYQVGPTGSDGRVTLGGYSISSPPGLPGPRGDGVVAVYAFDVVGYGKSDVCIDAASSGVSNPFGDVYNVVYANSGTVQVGEEEYLVYLPLLLRTYVRGPEATPLPPTEPPPLPTATATPPPPTYTPPPRG
jgi:parallel beta-helix repeat protein